jgi:hypothetical protein
MPHEPAPRSSDFDCHFGANADAYQPPLSAASVALPASPPSVAVALASPPSTALSAVAASPPSTVAASPPSGAPASAASPPASGMLPALAPDELPLAAPDEPLAAPDAPLPVPDVLPLVPEALPLPLEGLVLPQPTMGAQAKAARKSNSVARTAGNRRMRPRNSVKGLEKRVGLRKSRALASPT